MNRLGSYQIKQGVYSQKLPKAEVSLYHKEVGLVSMLSVIGDKNERGPK